MFRGRLRAVALILCGGWLSLVDSGFVSSGLLSNGLADEPPAAFCYFTTNARSYLADQNAGKFAELVQAELLAVNTDVRWVDRSDIDTALGELELQAFGKVDASATLQFGHWLKADVLIKGHLTLRSATVWSLAWEIIDLDRADVLASDTLSLKLVTAGDPPATPANLQEAQRSLSAGLTAALRLRDQLRSRVFVAPLYFRNAESVGRLDYLEQDLRRRFESRNAAQSAVRYLQFPRAENALDEANLIASGIVAADPQQWQRIADYYVWGTYREVESSGVPFSEVQVELVLELWNGRDATKRLTHRGQVKQLAALIDRAVADLEANAREKQIAPIATDVRKRLAEQLRVETSDLQEWVVQVDMGDFSRPADDWLRIWRQCIRLLAAAAFLDPTNEAVRRELLIETTREDLRFTTLPGNREFWRVWQCSDAWKAYCRQFGYDYQHAHMPKLKHRLGLADNRIQNSAVHTYLNTSQRLLVAVSGDTSRDGNAVPPGDVPSPTLQAWQDEIGRDHVERIKLALTRPVPKWYSYGWLLDNCLQYIRNPSIRAEAMETLWPSLLKDESPRISFNEKRLRETFALIGRPEAAERLIEAAKQKEASPPLASRPAVMRATPPQSPAATPAPLAPVVALPGKQISLKKHFYVQDVTAMEYAADRLWISVKGQFPSLSQGYALFTAREDGSDIRLFKGLSDAGSQVTSMLAEPAGLWLTLDGDGVCHIDQSGKIDRYAAREGLPSPKMFAIGRHGATLFVGGGQEQRGVLASFKTADKSWAQHELSQYPLSNGQTLPSSHVTRLTCNSDWLALFCHQGMSCTQILLRKQSGGEWLQVGERLRAVAPQFSHFDNDWRVNVATLAIADQLLWIATTRGLAAYDPATDTFPFQQLTPWQFTAGLRDEDALWLTAVPYLGNRGHSYDEKGSILVKFNLKTRTWDLQIPLHSKGTPDSLAQNAATIWVGMGSETSIVAIDKAGAR